MSRRSLIVAIGGAVSAIAVLAGSATSFAGSTTSARSAAAPLSGTITFADYGGDLQDAETKAWLTPWSKANPTVKLQQVTTYEAAKLKAQVETGNVAWNVVDTGPADGWTPPSKYMEKIDCTIVQCNKFNKKFNFNGYYAPYYVFSTVTVYNTDATGGRAPRGWKDFFDTTKFPGKRAVFNWSNTGNIEGALIASGVPRSQIYPLTKAKVDRALAKYDTIKKDLIFWSSGQQCVQLVASGEAAMGQCWLGRVVSFKKAGAKIDVDWGGCTNQPAFLGIPKGTKNLAAAQSLVAYITSPQHNGALSAYVPYSPPTIGAKESPVFKNFGSLRPSDHAKQCFTLDVFNVGKNYAMMSDAYAKWQTQ